jgi:transposase
MPTDPAQEPVLSTPLGLTSASTSVPEAPQRFPQGIAVSSAGFDGDHQAWRNIDGGTEEVPGGTAGAVDPDDVGRPAGPRLASQRVRRIGERLGINPETLRGWVTQAEVDAGARPGTTTAAAARLGELEREVRELRRANAILRSASVFFAAALDRPSR